MVKISVKSRMWDYKITDGSPSTPLQVQDVTVDDSKVAECLTKFHMETPAAEQVAFDAFSKGMNCVETTEVLGNANSITGT